MLNEKINTRPKYPKTENLYTRADDHFLNEGEFRKSEFGIINSWLCTEKVDGMNIRISFEKIDINMLGNNPSGSTIITETLETWSVHINGRTDNAQIPNPLLEYIEKRFTIEKFIEICKSQGTELYPITVYAEGYGPKIQSGGLYRDTQAVRIFDVLVGGTSWLDWKDVCDVASKFLVSPVPMIKSDTKISAVVDCVKAGFISIVSRTESKDTDKIMAEGVVCRTDPYLFNKWGERVCFKLKTKDFREELITQAIKYGVLYSSNSGDKINEDME